jgi:uncharacterized protein
MDDMFFLGCMITHSKEFGKKYHSEKNVSEESWSHKSIILKPLSTDPNFKDIFLEDEEIDELKVIGEFVATLDV